MMMISNTMAGRQTMPDSSHDIVSMVKKEISLFSTGGRSGLYIQNAVASYIH